jgi:hypothetical protein
LIGAALAIEARRRTELWNESAQERPQPAPEACAPT